jgi:hypothetical protein
MPAQPSPRRRFQFRLRTLMIAVTLICVVVGGYLGRRAQIARERKTLLDSIKADGGYVTDIRDNSLPVPPAVLRSVFGDDRVEVLVVPDTIDNETMAEIRRLFPDAEIAKKGDLVVPR